MILPRFQSHYVIEIRPAPISVSIPGALFEAQWNHTAKKHRIVLSLLRNGCALLYECELGGMSRFLPLSSYLADGRKQFRIKTVLLRCVQEKELAQSLDLMQRIGVKEFAIRISYETTMHMLFGSQVLIDADRVHLSTGVSDHIGGFRPVGTTIGLVR